MEETRDRQIAWPRWIDGGVRISAVAGPTASASHDGWSCGRPAPREPSLLTSLNLPFRIQMWMVLSLQT